MWHTSSTTMSYTPPQTHLNTSLSAVINDTMGNVLEYRHLIKSDKYGKVWEHSFANKLGQLFQGIRNIPGTYTCSFIRKAQVPKHKRATYSRIVCNTRPQKEEIYRTQLTVGGNLIDFPGIKSTPTADCWKSLVLPACPYSNASVDRAGTLNQSSK